MGLEFSPIQIKAREFFPKIIFFLITIIRDPRFFQNQIQQLSPLALFSGLPKASLISQAQVFLQ